MDNSLANARHGGLKRRLTALGLIVTLGIVFGDIGTSPLYVMKAITGANPNYSPDYIIGAVSCIIWTLTLQTTVKYVLIALRADNKGEGGILALYSLVKRLKHKWLYVVAAIGASTLIADGVITPAVTVTSAIEGLQAFNPNVAIVPIVIVVISLIFFVQRIGTDAIGRWFGPFMLLWFLMLGIVGVCGVPAAPGIFKAFNPWYAVKLLTHSPEWFLIMGAVFLCTTGAEALYSDLGHCGRLNISVSWIFVKAMLILNYLGQGAWLIAVGPDASRGANPFYSMMPPWLLGWAIAMSTGAAIIASQALISGSFTIFSEAINLNFWPRLRIKHPTKERGQLYIPSVNTMLYIGCVLTVLIFRSSSHMEAAYGLAITITMLMTTILLGFYLRHKGAPAWSVALLLVVFGALEGCFLVANAFKFMHGGWFTILIAGGVCAVTIVWNNAVAIRRRFVEFVRLDEKAGIISDISRDCEIPKFASNVVYLSNVSEPGFVESKLIYSIVNKSPKRADHYWIIHVEGTDAPDTLTYSVREVVPGVLFDIWVKVGFKVRPQVSVYLRQIVEDLVAAKRLDLTSSYPSLHSRGIAGDFRFVLIRRIFYRSSACRGTDALLMRLHAWLRRLGESETMAFGLDTSNLLIESVPLIINTQHIRRIAAEEVDDD